MIRHFKRKLQGVCMQSLCSTCTFQHNQKWGRCQRADLLNLSECAGTCTQNNAKFGAGAGVRLLMLIHQSWVGYIPNTCQMSRHCDSSPCPPTPPWHLPTLHVLTIAVHVTHLSLTRGVIAKLQEQEALSLQCTWSTFGIDNIPGQRASTLRIS